MFDEIAPAREAAAPVIIKKVTVVAAHGGHHGGAWKVAYADFVTAMMAFFLLLWIIGATNEDQRKGIADYFTPTIIQQQASGGSNGVLSGRSIQSPDGVQPSPAQSKKTAADPVATTGSFGRKEGPGAEGKSTRDGLGPAASARQLALRLDDRNFREIERALGRRIAADDQLKGLIDQVRFVKTKEGLRIELLDRAGFSMFGVGTARMEPQAARLVAAVARGIEGLPNRISIRGHTDALAFAGPGSNWTLSGARAEATRQKLEAAGVSPGRIARIEGVADREPTIAADPYDPRNRRISVTLLYREG
ncbi:MAG: OmpA family protein [Alphaproteobacteria bacterium]|nr:OmpA family protein [Alphaproteobacteria bacterium]